MFENDKLVQRFQVENQPEFPVLFGSQENVAYELISDWFDFLDYTFV